MGKGLYKVRADSLDDAYTKMRQLYGKDAVVLRTAQVKEGGVFGFMGRKRIELTVAAAEKADPTARRLSKVEQRYAAQAGVGSDERFSTTVAHFQRLIHEARDRAQSDEPAVPRANAQMKARPESSPGDPDELVDRQLPRREKPAVRREPQDFVVAQADGTGVIPFRKPQPESLPTEDLRREIREVRETLEALVAETPGAGLPAEVAPYYRVLVERGISRKQAAALVMRALREANVQEVRDKNAFWERIKLQVGRRITTTGGIALEPGKCKVVAFVGTTGVGKTTSIAKLAAHYAVRRRARVAFVTADNYRVAAPEQLKVYADIIGVPTKIANDPDEMSAAVRAYREYDLVLIDTAGGSQYNVKHLQELRATLQAAQPQEVHLVVGMGALPEDMKLTLQNFRALRPTAVMFSKLDETRRFGAMFDVIVESGWPVSYLCIGQDVPNDIRLARPDVMADLIVEGKSRRGKSSQSST